MEDLGRTIDEIVLLYTLEPSIKDIYVEGVSDKLVLQRFLEKNELYDVKVVEVHEIDFSSRYNEYPHIKSNNREKLITLNVILEKELSEELEKVSIIVDKDFDEALGKKRTGKYLVYTDYNSIELYLFNNHVVDIFYKTILHNFPIDGKRTIEIFTPILIDKFFVRMAIYNIGGISKDKFTSFERSITVDKKGLSITFQPHEHIQKVLNSVSRMADLQKCNAYFDESRKKPIGNHKDCIRGHDFIDLFFLFVNKIKNDIGLTSEVLNRVIYQCIDFSKLRKEKLFSSLLAKYH